jgi:hypothetical protein
MRIAKIRARMNMKTKEAETTGEKVALGDTIVLGM